jgi:hypothetical protein
MQLLASSALGERVKRLDQALEQETANFKCFIQVSRGFELAKLTSSEGLLLPEYAGLALLLLFLVPVAHALESSKQSCSVGLLLHVCPHSSPCTS